ncbi:MAG: hypothetical protein AAFR03_13025 [Pseudomonadota bacterium]
MVNTDKISDHLDGSGSKKERDFIRWMMRENADVAKELKSFFQAANSWKARSACVYYAMPFARESNDAFELGIIAVSDKSKIVRERACQLLAYSLRTDALPVLERNSNLEEFSSSLNDYAAAIDAIKCKNSDYFLDRDHSGMVKMIIKPLLI